MGVQKESKTRKSYDAEFKQEVIRMLASGRSAKEISEAFGIAENVGRHPGSLSLEENCNYEDKSGPPPRQRTDRVRTATLENLLPKMLD